MKRAKDLEESKEKEAEEEERHNAPRTKYHLIPIILVVTIMGVSRPYLPCNNKSKTYTKPFLVPQTPFLS